jgi:MFS family permease
MMLWSNVVRMLLVSFLAAIVMLGFVELWMLFILALAFGIADAFFFPAQGAITPTLVPPEQLLEANALVMGTAQLSLLVGPTSVA